MGKHHITTVTRDRWGVSRCSSSDNPGVQTLSVYQFRNSRTKRMGILQEGQLNGMKFPRGDEGDAKIDSLCLLYGYLQPYGRNTCQFIQSRASRRRGFAPARKDYRFERRVKEYAGR